MRSSCGSMPIVVWPRSSAPSSAPPRPRRRPSRRSSFPPPRWTTPRRRGRSRPRCSRAAASGACRACTSTCAACGRSSRATRAATRRPRTTKRSAAGATGHAESVRSASTRRRSPTGELLQIFFSVAHDPTQLDRQGPDSGPSTARTSSTRAIAEERSRRPTSRSWSGQGVRARHRHAGRSPPRLLPGRGLPPGLPAARTRHPYIVINDLPKIENLRRVFPPPTGSPHHGHGQPAIARPLIAAVTRPAPPAGGAGRVAPARGGARGAGAPSPAARWPPAPR